MGRTTYRSHSSPVSSSLPKPWQPTLGAIPDPSGVRFRVWAPTARRLDLVLLTGSREKEAVNPLEPGEGGLFAGRIVGAAEGTRYWLQFEDGRRLPDPASRFQPEGVHGPSEVVDPGRFAWTDTGWTSPPLHELVIYELHVGTFSPEGTFAGVQSRLDDLAQLGVSAVELMPVAEFPGRWNWGYDGVDLFAPCHQYGTPDDLRRLVDAAHRRGLAVILDVVYNHLGPDGAYLSAYSPYYFTDRHKSPWGDGVNLDSEHSEWVRRFFMENALHWLHEYHVDGLRLDATHALQDESPRHFLSELAETVREAVGGRQAVLIAEDERNLDRLVRARERGGFGLDGVWADDFHHQVRRLLAGDREGYFECFSGTTEDLATTLARGWFFTGQDSAHTGGPRGTDPTGIPLHRFVICLQNHDQVGNRAMGERLHHQVDASAYRAASALLLCAPQTPLLFMGQEWAASSPFLYFTDHEPELGQKVTEGRRQEFRAFSAFADGAARARIPDPQAESTFARSRLNWAERASMPHAGIARLYQALLHLRKTEPALKDEPPRVGRTSDAVGSARGRESLFEVSAPDAGTVMLRRRGRSGPEILLVARLQGQGPVDISDLHAAGSRWEGVLTTEDRPFSDNGEPPRIVFANGRTSVEFFRPSAIILRRRV